MGPQRPRGGWVAPEVRFGLFVDPRAVSGLPAVVPRLSRRLGTAPPALCDPLEGWQGYIQLQARPDVLRASTGRVRELGGLDRRSSAPEGSPRCARTHQSPHILLFGLQLGLQCP